MAIISAPLNPHTGLIITGQRTNFVCGIFKSWHVLSEVQLQFFCVFKSRHLTNFANTLLRKYPTQL